MKTIHALWIGLAIAGILGCATTPDPNRGFIDLDGQEKAIFMAYYPELNQEQRLELTGNPGKTYELIKKWGLAPRFFKEKPGMLPRFTAKPENYAGQKLVIGAKGGEDIIDRDNVELQAVLVYRDGRSVDVTSEVKWESSPPSLTKMTNHILEFECLHSDVVVSASLLGAISGSQTISIKKPLLKLTLTLAGSYTGTERRDSIQLQAKARCEDGTESDVSCLADWQGRGAEGCGHVLLQDKPGSQSRFSPTRIRASYGNQTAEYLLDSALRPSHR